MVALPILGYRNWADGATLAGGSWQTTWPLTNMQDIELALVARSSDATSGSTLVTIDLGSAKAIRLVAITGHNFGATATIRVRAAATSGDVTAAPAVDTTQNVWLGSNTPTTNTGQNGDPIHTPCALVILSAAQSYRYWRVDIADTGNADGYIEIGYLQLWEAIEFALGISIGPTLAPETSTIDAQTIGLKKIFDRRDSLRTYRCVTDNLTEAEADVILDIVRERDLDQPMFIIPDPSPADTGRLFRRAFLCRMRSLSALDQPYFDAERAAWDLEEVVA